MEYKYALIAVDAAFLVDILFTFLTAKFDLVTGNVIDNCCTLAKNYILSFGFIIDILCMLPWELFGEGDVWRLLGLIKILRVLRMRGFVSSLYAKSTSVMVFHISLILYL